MSEKYKFDEHYHDRIFFTADNHFSHANIIKYENRPFDNVHDMNKQMIEKWNETVPDNGIVFVLGDFIFNSSFNEIKEKLSGRKIFIRGNHDYKKIAISWPDIVELSVKDNSAPRNYMEFVLCHYPMMSWNKSFHGAIQLFGHVHSKYIGKDRRHYNVGVDVNDFKPVSYTFIKEMFLNHKNENM